MSVKEAYEISFQHIWDSRVNLLVNGGFEDSDGRATIAGIADEAVSMFHRWVFNKGGTTPPTCAMATETTYKKDNSTQSCEISCSVAGSGTPIWGIKQLVENWEEFKGQKASLRMPVHCAVASIARAYIDDGITKTYSSYHSGGGSFENLEVEDFTISTSATKLEIGLEIVGNITTVYTDNVFLAFGDTCMDYTVYDPVKNAEKISFSAYMTAALNDMVNNAFTKMTFDTELWDTNGNFDIVNNRFTAPFNGVYHFDFVFPIGNPPSDYAAAAYLAYFYVDGALVLLADYFWGAIATAKSVCLQCSIDMKLTAGQYVEVYGKQITGAGAIDIGIGSTQTRFTGHLLYRT